MKKYIFSLSLSILPLAGNATSLKALGVDNVCTSEELEADPLTQKAVYIESGFSDLMKAEAAQKLFDAATVDKVFKASNSVRDGVTSSHIVNILADAFRKVRKEEVRLIQEGKLKPIEEGKNYNSTELELRRTSMEAFHAQYVHPVLADNFRFYMAVMKQRDQKRTSEATPAAKEAMLKLAKDQRSMLNNILRERLPSVIEKFGEVREVTDLEHLPLSYRDGQVVTIRMKKGDLSIPAYPRMLMNQLNGEDEYFLRALSLWREYAKGQLEVMESNNQMTFDPMFPMSLANPVRDMDLYKRAAQQADEDVKDAQRVHAALIQLTDKEIFGLLDLFRALAGDNLPKCAAVVQNMNGKLLQKLIVEKKVRGVIVKSTVSTADKKFTEVQRKEMDQLAKDIVYYQDIYEVFSQAAAHALKK